MAEYEEYLNKKAGLYYYTNPKIKFAQEIQTLRKMLWFSHGHPSYALYGDDGEMQCSQCMAEYGFWDWKRTDIDEIEYKIAQANLKKMLGKSEP